MSKKFVLVSYDVSCDRRRLKLAKFLLNFGRRVQKSVFEVLATEKNIIKMKAGAEKFIDPETDSIRYYYLCGRCAITVESFGKGPPPIEDEELLIV